MAVRGGSGRCWGELAAEGHGGGRGQPAHVTGGAGALGPYPPTTQGHLGRETLGVAWPTRAGLEVFIPEAGGWTGWCHWP